MAVDRKNTFFAINAIKNSPLTVNDVDNILAKINDVAIVPLMKVCAVQKNPINEIELARIQSLQEKIKQQLPQAVPSGSINASMS